MGTNGKLLHKVQEVIERALSGTVNLKKKILIFPSDQNQKTINEKSHPLCVVATVAFISSKADSVYTGDTPLMDGHVFIVNESRMQGYYSWV